MTEFGQTYFFLGAIFGHKSGTSKSDFDNAFSPELNLNTHKNSP